MLRYFSILWVCAVLSSCGTSYKLDERDLIEQPYEVGDTLVFKSNRGGMDSIFIKEISRYSSPTDPLDVFPDHVETIMVTGQMTLEVPFESTMGRWVTRDFVKLLELHTGMNMTYFEMGFRRPRDTLRSFKIHVPVDSLRKVIASETLLFDSKKYQPIIPFEHDLLSFSWNRQLGYVGYEFKNDLKYELISMRRDGNELIY